VTLRILAGIAVIGLVWLGANIELRTIESDRWTLIVGGVVSWIAVVCVAAVLFIFALGGK